MLKSRRNHAARYYGPSEITLDGNRPSRPDPHANNAFFACPDAFDLFLF